MPPSSVTEVISRWEQVDIFFNYEVGGIWTEKFLVCFEVISQYFIGDLLIFRHFDI